MKVYEEVMKIGSMTTFYFENMIKANVQFNESGSKV